MRKLWAKSLMVRLVTSFLLLSWGIVSLVAGIAYLRASRALERSVFERLDVAATFKEEELNLWVNERRQDVLTISRSPHVQRWAEALLSAQVSASQRESAYMSLSEHLNTMLVGKPDLREIFIMDSTNGQVILSTDLSREGQRLYEEKYFTQGKLATFVQSVYPSPETGNPLMTVATPLFNEQAQHLGVVAIHLNLDQVDQIIQERAGMGDTGETYLIDSSKQFVSGERFGREAFKHGAHSEGIDAALSGEDGFGLYRNYADVPVIGVYRWIEDRELALLAEMYQQEALAPARRLAVTILLVGLGSAAALAVGVYVLARQIAHPILAMAQAVGRVTQGDLSQTVPVFTQDEIGTLAQAFNQMIKQLRDLLDTLEQRVAARTRDLQIAADVSKQVTTVLDIDELLERVVRATAKSFNLYACSVFLFDDVQQFLVETVSANAQGNLLSSNGLLVPLDAEPSIIALAARTRQAIVVADVQSTTHTLGNGLDVSPASVYLPIPALPDTRSELAIPMIRGDGLMGVFDLQSQSVNHFREEDVRVLTTLAEQIAIAVRNAELFAEMQRSRRAAEAASEAKSRFLANVSHELRTPLTSVLGFTKLIKKRLRDIIFPAVRAHLMHADNAHTVHRLQRAIHQVNANINIVVSEAERLTDIIDDVLDLAEMEMGEVQWETQKIAVPDLVEQALAETAYLFEAQPVELIVDVAPDLPLIVGDRARLTQVFVNLISNAIKFTDEGEVRVTVKALYADEGESALGDWLIVHIHDTGSGIATEDYDKVFERFEQVGNAITEKPQGTGLGLPLSKHIVEHYGGHIWLESELGKGSRFSFKLPISSHVEDMI